MTEEMEKRGGNRAEAHNDQSPCFQGSDQSFSVSWPAHRLSQNPVALKVIQGLYEPEHSEGRFWFLLARVILAKFGEKE